MGLHNEIEFENELCRHLAENGWLYSADDTGYDVERGLFPEDVFGWLRDSAPEELAKVVNPSDSDILQAKAELRILDRIVKVAGTDPKTGGGTLNVIKKGVGVTPANLKMFQQQPTDGLNPVTMGRYGLNRVRVMRQVYYSKTSKKSLDLVFFVNGIPVATAELKTDMTQSIDEALIQYKHDRLPKNEPLLTFGRGALVHFVVSNEEVHMTTRLDGKGTRFLPFNRGHAHGAGNPPVAGDSPASYFWRDVLQRDAWLSIVGKFIHYQFSERADSITGKKSWNTSVLFPRFHQWRTVSNLTAAASEEGAGHNYLIQHSAGSGKTNSIAWTAHRLASLHRADGTKVFDGVIVISDRNVLDGQLQRAVEQLEAVPGVFAPITSGNESSKSRALAAALVAGRQIIGVTLQTFPHALNEIRDNQGLKGRKYAIIADEAHSSQSGEAAKSLKHGLTSGASEEIELDTEDVLAAEMAARAGATGTLSFFAFTATPKAKTKELFGRPDAGGVMQAFDLYPMKQAIQEGFILDVLQNYTTYEMAAKIANLAGFEGDVEVDRDKGTKQMLQWVKLHPHNISQKVAVIVEHFRSNVAHHLAGRAKAMVVTGSRKEAVRYKKAIDAYILEKGYQKSLATLVAFSGELEDPEVGPGTLTERSMNLGLNGRSLEKAFAADKFQIMLVANKYQTGFDQPLLVAMYVDKRLSGIAAVQTLSRLNRVIPGKEKTFVLDFINDSSTILKAFQEYYEDAQINGASDPDLVHDLVSKLDAVGIYNGADVDAVAHKWVENRTHNGLYSHLKPAADVFAHRRKQALLQQNDLELATLDEFRSTIPAFLKAYDFFSQILDYGDTRIEKLAVYLKLLRRLLKDSDTPGTAMDLADVTLTHYLLKKQTTEDLVLKDGDAKGLQPLTEAGTSTPREKSASTIAALIERINKLFEGTGISDADQINAFESVMRHAEDNETLQREAISNGTADFNASPTLRGTQLEEIIYLAGEGHTKAVNVLLELADTGELPDLMILAGIQERARLRAQENASENG
jgi:type I restriction enzyme R subunit